MTDGKGGVVLLHGHGRTGRSMRTIAAALRLVGYATLAPNYGSRGRSMDAIVDHLVPQIGAFAGTMDGPVHFVTHSLGGLVTRSLVATARPERMGRVVMLGPPLDGSEWADLLIRIRLDRIILGPAAAVLRSGALARTPQPVDFELGIIAGDRAIDPIFPRMVVARPNDGKVSVAATRIAGMADHIVLPVSHTLMIMNRRVIAQTIAFLDSGAFRR